MTGRELHWRGFSPGRSQRDSAGLLRVENSGALDEHAELAPGCHFCVTRDEERPVLVFNQELALSLAFWRAIYRRDKRRHADLLSLCSGDGIDRLPMKSVKISNDFGALSEFSGAVVIADEAGTIVRASETLHGSPSFAGTSGPADVMFRFSAFRNDRRVTAASGLLAGSYCTSQSDFAAVPNALAAVGRYALPNPMPPVHVFRITPPPGTPLFYGTAVPLFGQAGGGAELEIGTALPPGSVVYMGTIPVW